MPALDVSLISFYFNPRPRKEGDISNSSFLFLAVHISIHALVKRATIVSYPFSFLTFYFNPRPRKEGDLQGGE